MKNLRYNPDLEQMSCNAPIWSKKSGEGTWELSMVMGSTINLVLGDLQELTLYKIWGGLDVANEIALER